jgi:acetyltransferase-like isoleucine patch superfamily enzyme
MKEALKTAARGAAFVAALPWIVSFVVRAPLLGRDRAIEGSTQALAWLPGLLGQYVRRAFLRVALDACGPNAVIEYGVLVSQAGTRIDDFAYIGPRCHIGLAHIGRDALIAAGVHIPSGGATHGTADVTRSIREQEGHRTMVHVGEGAWIGSAAVLMADVGRHSIVGAGAVVTKPLEPFSVAVGVPARVIRMRAGSADPSASRA